MYHAYRLTYVMLQVACWSLTFSSKSTLLYYFLILEQNKVLCLLPDITDNHEYIYIYIKYNKISDKIIKQW